MPTFGRQGSERLSVTVQIIMTSQPTIQLILEEIYSFESSSYLGKGSHYHVLSMPEIQQVNLLSTASTTRIFKHQCLQIIFLTYCSPTMEEARETDLGDRS